MAIGHFTIVSSPEDLGDGQGQNIRQKVDFNNSLIDDGLTMYNYLVANNFEESPFTVEQGIAQADNFQHEVHSKSQFLRKVGELANLVRVPNTWDVCIYYTGHGYIGSGNWVVGEDVEEVTFDEVIDRWTEGVTNTVPKNLTLILDSCQAGYWVRNLQNREDLREFQIAIIGASNSDETDAGTAYCGVFAPAWTEGIPIPGPQIPISFATEAYNSNFFFDKLINRVANA